MKKEIQEIISNSIQTKSSILNDIEILYKIEKAIDVTVKSLENGCKIWFCGNGGSAADAQHLSAELSGRFYIDRKALASEALHCNTSYLTAVANDYGYDHVYARLIEGCGKKGDVLYGLSTSGNSTNICMAFEIAQKMDIATIGLTGLSGGKMAQNSDLILKIPSMDTPRIQEAHIMLGHIICELVEKRIFGK